MKELKDSLNLIKQTAGTFIEQLSEKIEEIKKDQYYYIADDTRGGHLALSTLSVPFVQQHRLSNRKNGLKRK